MAIQTLETMRPGTRQPPSTVVRSLLDGRRDDPSPEWGTLWCGRFFCQDCGSPPVLPQFTHHDFGMAV